MIETTPVTAFTLKRVCTLQTAHWTDHLSYSLWNVPSLQERSLPALATGWSNCSVLCKPICQIMRKRILQYHLYSSWLLRNISLFSFQNQATSFLEYLWTTWICPTNGAMKNLYSSRAMEEFVSVFDLNLNFLKDKQALDYFGFVM